MQVLSGVRVWQVLWALPLHMSLAWRFTLPWPFTSNPFLSPSLSSALQYPLAAGVTLFHWQLLDMPLAEMAEIWLPFMVFN